METSPQKSSSSKKKPLETYAKYSTMGFQMAAIIFGLTYAGIKLDAHFKLSFPAFTIFLALLSVVIAIYFAVKDLLKK
jgi:ATP synthase protein I